MELKQLHTTQTDLLQGFAESRIGGRAENQDSYGSADTKRGFLAVMCDGMGGGPGGKTASSIAVETIIRSVQEAPEDEEQANVVIKAIRNANMAILERAAAEPTLKGMGSTAVVALFNEDSVWVAHVGDSRCYQIRGKKKAFRTFDHSMVFELVKQGVISEEQARLSAQSNVITRALGIKPDVEVSIEELSFEKGDRFLLCSDGIHGTMPEANLIQKLSNRKMALGALVDDIATGVDNQGRQEGGGHDNLTLLLIETKKNSLKETPMNKKAKISIAVLGFVCIASLILNIVLLSKSSCEQTVPEQQEQKVSTDIMNKAKESDSEIKVPEVKQDQQNNN